MVAAKEIGKYQQRLNTFKDIHCSNKRLGLLPSIACALLLSRLSSILPPWLNYLPLSFSMVCLRRCHRMESLAISSSSMALRPALPICISLFFLGLPLML
jgi:hypothetical protein